MKFYIVCCDGIVSQEGYITFEKAESFILNRSDKPKQVSWHGWTYSSGNHIYIIKEIEVK